MPRNAVPASSPLDARRPKPVAPLRRASSQALVGDEDRLRALSGGVPLSASVVGAMQRLVGNRSTGQALQRLSGTGTSSISVQRYREFDKVAGTKVYANGGKGIDGEDDSHHFSMNPRGPDSPVANHFNEVHVTFDENTRGEELDWDARPHFYYSDEASPKYIPKDDTAANVRFRQDHEIENEGGSDGGWQEYAALKARSKPLVTTLIPKLPVYEGKAIADVQAVHAERLRKAEEAAAAKKLLDDAAAAEKLADAEAEKAGKKRLRVTYENSRHKKANVESYAEQLKTRTGALAASAQKAQGRGASACTVTLEFGDFAAAKAAIGGVGKVKEPGNGEPLTVTIV